MYIRLFVVSFLLMTFIFIFGCSRTVAAVRPVSAVEDVQTVSAILLLYEAFSGVATFGVQATPNKSE